MTRLIIALLLFTLLFTPSSVFAQSETPTPSPTPAYQQAITLSSGNTLLVDRRVTFGDIALVTALLILAAVELVKTFVEMPRRWVHK